MADRADRLIARGVIKFLPCARVGPLTSRAINDLPEIHPLFEQDVVLNRKDVDFAVGKSGSVGLLPFGADCVVDGVRVPLAVGLQEIEIVALVTDDHPSKEGPFPPSNEYSFFSAIFCIVSQIKLVVGRKIAHYIFRRVRAKHFRHAACRPLLVNIGMAPATRFRTDVSGLTVHLWGCIR